MTLPCVNHDLIDITTMSDFRRRMFCLNCKEEVDGGELPNLEQSKRSTLDVEVLLMLLKQ